MFEVPVYISPHGENSAAFGAAVRAMHGYRCWSDGAFVPLESILSSKSAALEVVCQPQAANFPRYRRMLTRYAALELAVRKGM